MAAAASDVVVVVVVVAGLWLGLVELRLMEKA